MYNHIKVDMNEKVKNQLIGLINSNLEATEEFVCSHQDPYGKEGQKLWAKKDKTYKQLFDFINSL